MKNKQKKRFKLFHSHGFETLDLKFELYFLFTKSVQCTESLDRLSLTRTRIWTTDRTVSDWSATCCCPCVCGCALLRGSFSTVWSIFHIFDADPRLDQLFLSNPLLPLVVAVLLLLFGALGLSAADSGRRCARSCSDHDEGLQMIPNCVWECECDRRGERRCLESSTDDIIYDTDCRQMEVPIAAEIMFSLELKDNLTPPPPPGKERTVLDSLFFWLLIAIISST